MKFYPYQAKKIVVAGEITKCEECPKEFAQDHNLQKRFCSAKCRKRSSRKNGAFIVYRKYCKQCTIPFEVRNHSEARRNYCKDACKAAAYRIRRDRKKAA